MLKKIGIFALLLLLSACSQSDDDDSGTPDENTSPPVVVSPPEEPEIDQPGAARFLNQATFGATYKDIVYLTEINREAWLDEQFNLPVNRHLPLVEPYQNEEEFWRTYRMAAWFERAIYAPDQLRQRMAFALSEILVVSERHDSFFDQIPAITNYYDLLLEHSFGNYRELLEAVTLSPIMGSYLSMLGNEKPDETKNIRPDENYAREIMQLFSIGLVELNMDGSVKLDAQGDPIPTYDQDVIKGFAHVFTGWHFSTVSESNWYWWWDFREFFTPMNAVDAFHDSGAKTLFPGVELEAGQSAEDDLQAALDALFNHPNVAPFVAKQLIQKFVTSNPSAEYVERVSTVFEDNGNGERGDLEAVLRSLLLDEEARIGHEQAPNSFGKIREPILKATHLWRAFNLTTEHDYIDFAWPDYFFNQAPLASPSVFNFFRPDYSPPLLKNDHDLLAPELQIITESAITNGTNYLAWYGLWRSFSGEFSSVDEDDRDGLWIDLSEYVELTDDSVEDMMQRLNLVLTAGSLPDEAIAILVEEYESTPWNEPHKNIANAIFLIMASPQYAVMK